MYSVISQVKTEIALLFLISLILCGCSQQPSVKFGAEWLPENISEMWDKSGNILIYNKLKTDKSIKAGDEKYFVLLVKGALPLGLINIKTIRIGANKRETARIEPNLIQNSDPKADIRAIQIKYLVAEEDNPYRTVFRILETGKNIVPGHYYISLQTGNTELAASELKIVE